MTGKNIKSYIGSTLLCMLFSLLAFLPMPLSFLFEILTVSFLAKIAIRHHYIYLSATSCIILAIFVAIGGFESALITGVTVVLLGLSVGASAKLGLSCYKLLFLCTVLYVVNISATIIFVQNQIPEFFSLDYYYEIIESSLSQLTEAGYFLETQAHDLIMQTVRVTILFLMQITPAIIIVSSIVCAYILIRISGFILNKNSDIKLKLVSFSQMHLGIVHAIVFLVLFAILSIADIGKVTDLITNIVIILAFLFFCSGLSFFDWKMRRKGKKKPTRFLIEVLVVISSYFLMFMPLVAFVATGIFDSVCNLRKRNIKA